MGLNIIVIGPKGQYHPDWDDGKLAGDKEFAKFFSTIPCENTNDAYGEEPEFRITDFPAWRAAIASQEWPNPGRYEHLMDILEASPDFRVYLSI